MSLAVPLLGRARSIRDLDFPNAGTAAATLAARNFEANRIALEATCPASAIALPDALPEMEWVYARDGALSARHCDGHWFADVSVPRRAAERMLASLEVTGSSAILLAPPTASLIRVALDRSTDRQALIAILPGEHAAGVICACEDFADAIRTRRLLIVVGPDWQRELDQLLERETGLAPAALFVRVPGLNETLVERMIKPAERVIARHNGLHRHQLALLNDKPRQVNDRPQRVCVVTGRFKLWQAESATLADIAARSSLDCVTFDASRPDRASVLSFAKAVDGCDAVLAANIVRADLPLAAPASVGWTTLLTRAQVPAPSANAKDRLLVVDATQRDRAIASGWQATRVRLVADPAMPARPPVRPTAVPALILDCRPAQIPASVRDLSSHAVVWERCVQTIEQDFASLSRHATPAAFVAACAARIGVPVDGLPLDLICETAVLPTFARRLAIELAQSRVAFAIWGEGWDAVPEVAGHWRGPITSPETFAAAIEAAGGVLDVWPSVAMHASRRCGRPLIAAWGRTARLIEQSGRAAATAGERRAEAGPAPLSIELLAEAA